MESFEETIRTLNRARYPIIWTVTHEEARALRSIEAVARNPNPTKNAPAIELYLWSASAGMQTVQRKEGKMVLVDEQPEATSPVEGIGAVISASRSPEINREGHGRIYVLRDLHKFLGEKDNLIYRLLRDAALALKESRVTMVITSPVANLPVELQKDVTVVSMPLPTAEELRYKMIDVLQPLIDNKAFKLPTNGAQEELLRAGLGLTEEEFGLALAESLIRNGKPDAKFIVRAKEQIVRKMGFELYQATEGLGDIGGLNVLKADLQQVGLTFTEKARKFGLRPPRGFFLTGPPGTGKTAVAKAAASTLGVPLIKVGAESVFSKYVGESEQNLSRLFQTVDAIAPAILFIDEVEKFLSGSAGSQAGGDSGVTRRVFGQMLSWMQDHTSPVIVICTANNPLGVPPEFGSRFDQTYYVGLPDVQARAEIFGIHIRKLGRDPKQHDIADYARISEGFNGREIEQAVNKALRAAFQDGTELDGPHVIAAINGVKPLSKTRATEIQAMREWAEKNATPATSETREVRRPLIQ